MDSAQPDDGAPQRTLVPGAEGGSATRLDFRELCGSGPFDVFRASLNRVFYPAHVRPTERSVPDLAGSRLSAANLQHLTFGLVCFGVETSVDPGALGSYHVNVPIAGAVESHCGQRQTVAAPGYAHRTHPPDPARSNGSSRGSRPWRRSAG